MNMDETRLNTIPAQEMSIDERLDEIALIMACGIKRLKAKSKKKSLNNYFSGLRTELKRSCDKGDQKNAKHTDNDSTSKIAKHANS